MSDNVISLAPRRWGKGDVGAHNETKMPPAKAAEAAAAALPAFRFADPTFPLPSFSVWEASMHRWLSLEPPIERFSEGRIGKPLGVVSADYPGAR
jgi:hypothetical protein